MVGKHDVVANIPEPSALYSDVESVSPGFQGVNNAGNASRLGARLKRKEANLEFISISLSPFPRLVGDYLSE